MPWLNLAIDKALRKVENSDFHIFAKFGTHFFCIPFSVFSISRQNRIFKSEFHKTKLFRTKNIHFEVKNVRFESKNIRFEKNTLIFGSKSGVSE